MDGKGATSDLGLMGGMLTLRCKMGIEGLLLRGRRFINKSAAPETTAL